VNPRLVLVGLPGSGKSSVGVAVADRLGVAFADSDDLVIKMTGRAIREIFERDGEAVFRELEAAAITAALVDFEGVLALGGGAVTSSSVRRELAATDVAVVLLTAEQPELLRRVAGTTHRPLLAGDAAARLADLASTRDGLYRQVATTTLDTTHREVADVAVDIVDYLSEVGT
jgi:shikimate kinase